MSEFYWLTFSGNRRRSDRLITISALLHEKTNTDITFSTMLVVGPKPIIPVEDHTLL